MLKYTVLTLTCLLAAAYAVDDFRYEFDRLLVETSMRQFTQVEHRLLDLTHDITHLEAFPSQAEKDKIIREMETLIAFTEEAQTTFTRELKRPDLNLIEKVNFESALKTAQVIVGNLKAFETKVRALKVVSPTHKPTHPLHLTVADFKALEARLVELQAEIVHLEGSKSKTEQARIIKEIETAQGFIATNLPKLEAELKRKDLPLTDKVILEIGVKMAPILIKDLKEAKTKVKAVKAH